MYYLLYLYNSTPRILKDELCPETHSFSHINLVKVWVDVVDEIAELEWNETYANWQSNLINQLQQSNVKQVKSTY